MARVVVIVSGGVVQSVFTDNENTEVLILDEDCDGCDKVQTLMDKDGDTFEAIVIPEGEYCPDQVESYFKQAVV